MNRSLGVVVPAFQPDVRRLERYLAALREELSPAVVRVELDDPDEDTLAAVRALDAEVHAVPYRRGKGAAVTAGFEALDTDDYCFLDADGSTPAASAARVVAALDEAPVAVGSRRHPDAHVAGHQTVARRFLGDGFAWVARRLLDADLYDYQCGAKAVRAEAWERVRDHLYEPGFAWDVEFVAMAAALGYRVAEVPIEWEDAPGSTVDPLRTALDMGRALFVARHRAKRLQNSRLHDALAASRADPVALVDREESER
ncbi:glycosyltransferase [Halosegnis marinus]|uniref:Glycosyltransferase n=1 Tax=Halosegnis marinus TaxID=3034023 RepID=A0ABD5ZQN5_9EURY|nr:glycosyltransferase [Halosegnis sp. DT85]